MSIQDQHICRLQEANKSMKGSVQSLMEALSLTATAFGQVAEKQGNDLEEIKLDFIMSRQDATRNAEELTKNNEEVKEMVACLRAQLKTGFDSIKQDGRATLSSNNKSTGSNSINNNNNVPTNGIGGTARGATGNATATGVGTSVIIGTATNARAISGNNGGFGGSTRGTNNNASSATTRQAGNTSSNQNSATCEASR